MDQPQCWPSDPTSSTALAYADRLPGLPTLRFLRWNNFHQASTNAPEPCAINAEAAKIQAITPGKTPQDVPSASISFFHQRSTTRHSHLSSAALAIASTIQRGSRSSTATGVNAASRHVPSSSCPWFAPQVLTIVSHESIPVISECGSASAISAASASTPRHGSSLSRSSRCVANRHVVLPVAGRASAFALITIRHCLAFRM